jgi:hypothetical protein
MQAGLRPQKALHPRCCLHLQWFPPLEPCRVQCRYRRPELSRGRARYSQQKQSPAPVGNRPPIRYLQPGTWRVPSEPFRSPCRFPPSALAGAGNAPRGAKPAKNATANSVIDSFSTRCPLRILTSVFPFSRVLRFFEEPVFPPRSLELESVPQSVERGVAPFAHGFTHQ